MMKQKEKLGLIQQHQGRSDRESEGEKKQNRFLVKISAEWNRGCAHDDVH